MLYVSKKQFNELNQLWRRTMSKENRIKELKHNIEISKDAIQNLESLYKAVGDGNLGHYTPESTTVFTELKIDFPNDISEIQQACVSRKAEHREKIRYNEIELSGMGAL